MKRIYIVDGNRQYYELYRFIGFTPVSELKEADIVAFTGGEDVSPYLYNHRKHSSTFCSIDRDQREQEIFHRCVKKGIPMVGICRGGQFLNVMNGGTMYQDVTGHGLHDGHLMLDKKSGKDIFVSSTHHQMMCPGKGAEVLCIAKEQGKRLYWDEASTKFIQEDSMEDIEVVKYPATKTLCYQPHPEYSSPSYQQMREHFKGLVLELVE